MSIDERLASAQTAADVVLWTQVRGEVIRQDEDASDRQHARVMQRTSLYATVGLSVVGVSVGVLLLALGQYIPGLFALGAGLYRLAPEFTRAFLTPHKSESSDDQP
jgi:hypothetical protein